VALLALLVVLSLARRSPPRQQQANRH
jgi:hypothetical protein